MGSSTLLPKYKENIGNSSIGIANHHYSSLSSRASITFTSTSWCLAIFFVVYMYSLKDLDSYLVGQILHVLSKSGDLDFL